MVLGGGVGNIRGMQCSLGEIHQWHSYGPEYQSRASRRFHAVGEHQPRTQYEKGGTYLSGIGDNILDIRLGVNLGSRVCALCGEFWELGDDEGEGLRVDNVPSSSGNVNMGV
jgi:hypothetical protein